MHEKGGSEGSGDGNILKGVTSFPRDYWDLSVRRLVDSTTEEQVRRQLHFHGIEVKEIFILPSHFKGTKAAKVRVALEHREKAQKDHVWPKGCQVSDWIYKPKQARKPAASKGAHLGHLDNH